MDGSRGRGSEGGQAPGLELRFRPGAEAVLTRLGLDDPARLLAGGFGEPVRRTPHRRTEHVIGPGGTDCYLKLYGPGAGRIGKIHRHRAPAEVEWDRARACEAAGLPVPTFLCAVWGRAGGEAPSAVLIAGVPGAAPLDRVLAEEGFGDRRRAWCEGPLLDMVADLHAAGFQHRDLYAAHVLVAGFGPPTLIDLARIRHQDRLRRRRRVKDLAAMVHSVRRLVPAGFVEDWIRAYGVRCALRPDRLLRSVRRKAARIAAHVPRYDRPE